MKLFNNLNIHLIFMGCTDSATVVDNTRRAPKHLHSSIEAAIKEQYVELITDDRIKEVIQIDSRNSIPANCQLSEGEYWSTIHFCCRFGAHQCLDFFLRKCFVENFDQYIDLVNGQTIEGYTCLHLCLIYDSEKCFDLLVKYGGLNLKLRDAVYKSINVTAVEYRRTKMAKIVAELEVVQGRITKWNYRLLAGEEEEQSKEKTPINQISEEQKQMINKKRSLEKQREDIRKEMSDKEKIAHREYLDGLIQIKQRQTNLKQEIIQEPKQIRQKHRKQMAQSKKKSTQEFMLAIDKVKEENNSQKMIEQTNRDEQDWSDWDSSQQSVQQYEKKQIEVINHREAELALRLKQKEEEIQKTREQLQKKRQDQIQNNIQQQIRNAQQSKKNQKQHVKNFNTFKQVFVGTDFLNKFIPPTKEQQKQQEQKRNHLAASKSGHPNINSLPAHIQQRYQKAKSAGIFRDEEFPHNGASLGKSQKMQNLSKSSAWLRPTQFLNKNFQLFDGIDPNDIKQGGLGVCYCLAMISQLARDPARIKEMFIFWDLQIGFYVLRFFTSGKENFMVVDDHIPCNKMSKTPLFAKPIGNQIWVLLVEKAWSKTIGSYFAAESMTPDHCMQDLTGCPSYGARFANTVEKTKDIKTYCAKNCPVVLTTGQKKIEGMVAGHAYSLLECIEYKGETIYKIRNPWGRFEWNGYYGENSPNWTAELKDKVTEEQGGDDGIFFMSQSELLQSFIYFSITIIEPGNKVSFTELSCAKNEDIYYTFNLPQASNLNIRVHQPFDRIIKVKDNSYKYSPLTLQFGKIEGDGVKFISEGSTRVVFGAKSVHADDSYMKKCEKGQYFLRLRFAWQNESMYNKAVISAYASKPVQFKRLDQNTGIDLWTKMIKNHISSKSFQKLGKNKGGYVTEWMKGQLIVYGYSNIGSGKFKFEFQQKNLKNCRLGYNQNGNNVQFHVEGNGVENGNFGTVDKIVTSLGCSSGSFQINLDRD